MRKSVINCALAGVLLSGAGLAAASEPMVLSEAQLDSVAAGALSSTASGTAYATYGTAYVRASTSSYASGPVRSTSASVTSVAIGYGARATGTAGSTY